VHDEDPYKETSEMKISVTAEGRDNIFVPDPDSLIAWIEDQGFKHVHNFMVNVTPGVMVGADHNPKGVMDDIRNADRLALTTGAAWTNNMKHALSIIRNNELQVYDIGELTESDLTVLS
jgi:hypothetical protein